MARNIIPARTPAAMVPITMIFLILHGILGADYVIARFQLGAPGWPGLISVLPLVALWLKVAWAMGVWLGLAAAVFLLLRDNASVLLFFAALVSNLALVAGLIAAQAPGLIVPLPVLLAALVVVPALGWMYSRALNRKGVLH